MQIIRNEAKSTNLYGVMHVLIKMYSCYDRRYNLVLVIYMKNRKWRTAWGTGKLDLKFDVDSGIFWMKHNWSKSCSSKSVDSIQNLWYRKDTRDTKKLFDFFVVWSFLLLFTIKRLENYSIFPWILNQMRGCIFSPGKIENSLAAFSVLLRILNYFP